jgi:SAM-dependent MidA family methyltransferase
MTAELVQTIREAIRREGPLPFDRYVSLALYHPRGGYYRRGRPPEDDYLTAPGLTPLFGRLVGTFLARLAERAFPGERPVIAEVGAGRGRLAAGAAGSEELGPLLERGDVTWVAADFAPPSPTSLPAGVHPLAADVTRPFFRAECGLVVANELFDALPFAVAEGKGGTFREVLVDWQGDRFVERLAAGCRPAIQDLLSREGLPPDDGCRFEVSLPSRDLLVTLADSVERGFLLVVDYGGGEDELLDRAAGGGTARAFASHTVLPALLERPGEADLTADVNFTRLETWGLEAGWEPLWRGRQGDFLISLGLLEQLAALVMSGDRRSLTAYLAAKQFLLPGGLADRFRVLVLAKGVAGGGGAVEAILAGSPSEGEGDAADGGGGAPRC